MSPDDQPSVKVVIMGLGFNTSVLFIIPSFVVPVPSDPSTLIFRH